MKLFAALDNFRRSTPPQRQGNENKNSGISGHLFDLGKMHGKFSQTGK
jgi:hypothetical protein